MRQIVAYLIGLSSVHSGISQLANICSSSGSDFRISFVVSDDVIEIVTSGCPHYDWTDETTPNDAEVQNFTYVIPINPKLCDSPTQYVGVYTDLQQTTTNPDPVVGAVGIAFDGVALFSSVDSEMEDAYISEGETFDTCNGHPNSFGVYHYHSEIPEACLMSAASIDEHSHFFGVMADGVPIFGPLGDSGISPTDLDECGGHVDESYPFYHYHLPSDLEYPYTVNCLKGEINASAWTNFQNVNTCDESEQQYDYSNLLTLWQTVLDEYVPSSGTKTSSTYAYVSRLSYSVVATILLLTLSAFG